jgi:hypothetical protein
MLMLLMLAGAGQAVLTVLARPYLLKDRHQITQPLASAARYWPAGAGRAGRCCSLLVGLAVLAVLARLYLVMNWHQIRQALAGASPGPDADRAGLAGRAGNVQTFALVKPRLKKSKNRFPAGDGATGRLFRAQFQRSAKPANKPQQQEKDNKRQKRQITGTEEARKSSNSE